jgi:dihydroorotate dehydrogenase
MYAPARCLLFRLDPETAHRLSVTALKSGLPLTVPPVASPRLRVQAAGLDFPNPLGMAAGYDKNAEVPGALLRAGFGFVEVGTVTPRPQSGNPPPRLFRLPADRAVINRLGFNNEGHVAVLARLEKTKPSGIVGVNLGANRDSTDRVADYERGIEVFGAVADYLAINISSPNTPGLRDLQAAERLAELLTRCISARNRTGRRVPLFVKLSPDLDDAELDETAAAIAGAGIEGIIVSNTTVRRDGLRASREAAESGGLSGAPLFARSTRALARLRRRLGRDIVLIGAGGIDSAEAALEKIRAGADLLQLYTGLIYQGPGLPGRIVSGLDHQARRDGLASIRELRDSRLDHWADLAID